MGEKIVLIGAGSAMFTRGLLGDLIRKGWSLDLALVDVDPKALEVAQRMATKMIQASKAPIQISASTDRRKVLPGATCIICTIGVGGRRAWEQDVFIPRKYGIYQPVGDTSMPGGLSRALRMIPAMVAIAKDVMELCPQALFFNYANPMTAICTAVRKATGANLVGLCAGVSEVGRYLASALEVRSEDLRYAAVGLNHMTWFVEARLGGQDAMPRLKQMAEAKERSGDNPFSWRLLRLFGAFPCVLDRHIVEFFPEMYGNGEYEGQRLGVDAFSFEDTIADGDRIYAEMQAEAFADKPLPADFLDHLEGEQEEATDILDSIRRDLGKVYSTNLPNQGQVPNLPEGAILECPASAGASGMRPLAQPSLATGPAGLIAKRLACVAAVVEAALTGSRDQFVQALVLDGSVKSLAQAGQLADELLQAQKPYLPQFQKNGPLVRA
jgi:alpha-galactosidase